MFRRRPRPAHVEIHSPVVERFTLRDVPVLLVRAERRGKGRDVPRPLVVHHHGSVASKETDLALYLRLSRRGYVVAALDAPYHGERAAPERPPFARVWLAALQTAAAETRMALDALVARPDVDPARVAVSGKSMGSFRAALAAAHDTRIKALVSIIGGGAYRLLFAHSTNPDVRSLPADRIFAGRLGRRVDSLDPVNLARRLARVPVLALAGADDRVVPPACAEAFVQALRAAGGRVEHRVWAGVAHRLTPEMIEATGAFLDETIAADGRASTLRRRAS